MLITVEGREYRVHIHNGEYRAVYTRISVSPSAAAIRGSGLLRSVIERRVKVAGPTWKKVVSAHRAALIKA